MRSGRQTAYPSSPEPSNIMAENPSAKACLPEATRPQGTYDWFKGKQASAQNHWQLSLALSEQMGMRYDLGMAHLETGRRLDNRAHLQKAEGVFAGIGAEWDVEQARRYLKPLAERNDA